MRPIPTDVRHGFRRLAATPLLSLGAVLTLSLGIGSAVVMADVLDRLLLRAPAHVTDLDRVSLVYKRSGQRYGDRIDYATFDVLGTMREEIEASAVFFSDSLSLGRGERARPLEVVAHSRDYFAVLGVPPLIGSLT